MTDPLTPLVRGQTVDFRRRHVMGILNCTPDSFSDGGHYLDTGAAVRQVAHMVASGATMIDVGGESTRPGSEPVSEQEELDRVLPVLDQIISAFPDVLFSVDTTKYAVAKAALQRGVHFINDISGLRFEPRFPELCAQHGAGLIIMHSVGQPKTMQENPHYQDVVGEVLTYLRQAAQEATSAGVTAIIIDPGVGFGKTLAHNLSIINAMATFAATGYPVLLGASRKSMIGNILGGRPPDQRVAGTISLHYHALMLGARILRVHDVQEASDSVAIFNALEGHEPLA